MSTSLRCIAWSCTVNLTFSQFPVLMQVLAIKIIVCENDDRPIMQFLTMLKRKRGDQINIF